jgi:hypothetical protein
VTTYGGIPGRAEAAACLADARTAQQASYIYAGRHGQPASSLNALVAEGELRAAPSASHGYIITYDSATGKVQATGACRFPG